MNRAILKIVAGVVCCASVFLFSACGHYNDRAWKTVDFESSPDRATVFINGRNCGLTPLTERLSRSGSYSVRFSKPGFFDETSDIESFVDENGRADIVERVSVTLREAVAEAENPAAVPATETTASAAAPASEKSALTPAQEFSALPAPTDFTDFRLREKDLKNLLQNGKITETEYETLHEQLYNAYNENRLLKTPRLGTYEKKH